MIMHLWRVSGELLKVNLFITADAEADKKQFGRSVSTYKSFTTDRGDRHDLDICHLWLMNRNSTKITWQHKGFGIHY